MGEEAVVGEEGGEEGGEEARRLPGLQCELRGPQVEPGWPSSLAAQHPPVPSRERTVRRIRRLWGLSLACQRAAFAATWAGGGIVLCAIPCSGPHAQKLPGRTCCANRGTSSPGCAG